MTHRMIQVGDKACPIMHEGEWLIETVPGNLVRAEQELHTATHKFTIRLLLEWEVFNEIFHYKKPVVQVVKISGLFSDSEPPARVIALPDKTIFKRGFDVALNTGHSFVAPESEAVNLQEETRRAYRQTLDLDQAIDGTKQNNKEFARIASYATKMEDAARAARERPGQAAGEIVRMIWNQLGPDEKTIALEIQLHDGNMNKAAKSLGKNFSAVRRCREHLRGLYAAAQMELPQWLLNRDEFTAWKQRQDANPGQTTPGGDFVRTNPDDADGLNNI